MDRLATADELADFLDDATIPATRAELMLDLVSGLVRAELGQALHPVVDDVVRVHGTGTELLTLPEVPVGEVASIVEDPDGAATELTSGVDFDWSPDGLLFRLSGTWRRRYRWYEITYSHGYDEIPDGIKAVVLRVAARGVVNPEGLATEQVQSAGVGYAFDDSRMLTLSAPDRRSLDRYRP